MRSFFKKMVKKYKQLNQKKYKERKILSTKKKNVKALYFLIMKHLLIRMGFTKLI
jgi:hypothetical protein